MPRLRTLALAAVVVVMTDVTWDGTSLHISFGWPGRKRLVQLVIPQSLFVGFACSRMSGNPAIAQDNGPTDPVPIGVAFGAGSVWVLNGNTGTVTRVDPALDAVVATVSRVSLDATRIAASPRAVWVADVAGNAVLRIDPATNRVVRTIAVGGKPKALVAGRSGVWVAVDSTQLWKGAAPQTFALIGTSTARRTPATTIGARYIAL